MDSNSMEILISGMLQGLLMRYANGVLKPFDLWLGQDGHSIILFFRESHATYKLGVDFLGSFTDKSGAFAQTAWDMFDK